MDWFILFDSRVGYSRRSGCCFFTILFILFRLLLFGFLDFLLGQSSIFIFWFILEYF